MNVLIRVDANDAPPIVGTSYFTELVEACHELPNGVNVVRQAHHERYHFIVR